MNMPESLRCPECNGTTTTHTVDSMQMEVCEKCGGVWFGANQLKKVIADGAAALDELMGFEPKGPHALPNHSNLTCPHCRILLHRNNVAGAPDVQVDTCYACGGLYLAADALAKLDAAAHQPVAPPTPISPEAQQAGAALDAMVQNDLWRARMMSNWTTSRMYGTNPYFRIAGL